MSLIERLRPQNHTHEQAPIAHGEEALQAEIPDQNPLNRRARRLNERTKPKVAREIDSLNQLLIFTQNQWNKTISGDRTTYAEIIFQREPIIYQFLEARRRLPQALKSAYFASLRNPNYDKKVLDQMDARDLFSQKIDGTSLLDVENMPLPLTPDDIKRISDMLHISLFPKRRNPKHNLVRDSIILLAAQESARPDEKLAIPDNLKPLKGRLTDYFDYFVGNLINLDSLSSKQLFDFFTQLWRGRPYLSQGLACYLPARLGLSPSSASKFFDSVFGVSIGPLKPGRFLNTLNREAEHALRKSGFPGDVQKYMEHDQQADKHAWDHIFRFYKNHPPTDSQQGEAIDATKGFLDTLANYHKAIYREIAQSPNKQLEVALPETSVARSLTITSLYRQTLVVVLHLPTSHLTLELARIEDSYRAFGFPQDLDRENPHTQELILADVLKHVIKTVLPQAAPEALRKPKTQIFTPLLKPIGQTPTSQLPEVQGKNAPKRKTLAVPEQPLPTRQDAVRQNEGRKNIVIHSRTKVAGCIGKKVNPKLIDRSMEAIRRFEFGQVTPKPIDSSGGIGFSIRVGDLRIIVERLSSGVYTLEAIGDRESVYSRYDHYKD